MTCDLSGNFTGKKVLSKVSKEEFEDERGFVCINQTGVRLRQRTKVGLRHLLKWVVPLAIIKGNSKKCSGSFSPWGLRKEC